MRLCFHLACTALLLGFGSLAQADVEKGKKVFRKCKACHEVGPDAKSKTGPVLSGIIGAPAGRDAEFSYSDALISAANDGLVWDEAALTAFLSKPRDFMKGTKMSFSGLRKESDVQNLILFLEAQN